MDAKLGCEVDVEGAVGVVDMMNVEKEDRQVGALACAQSHDNRPTNVRACGICHWHVALTRYSPNQIPI